MVAFERCVNFMVEMLEKYGAYINIDETANETQERELHNKELPFSTFRYMHFAMIEGMV